MFHLLLQPLWFVRDDERARPWRSGIRSIVNETPPSSSSSEELHYSLGKKYVVRVEARAHVDEKVSALAIFPANRHHHRNLAPYPFSSDLRSSLMWGVLVLELMEKEK